MGARAAGKRFCGTRALNHRTLSDRIKRSLIDLKCHRRLKSVRHTFSGKIWSGLN